MYLNCHSYFSLRYGTLSVEKLVEEAAAHGVRSMALTDINNSTGVLDFVQECRRHKIKPLAGIEFRNDQFRFTWVLPATTKGFMS
jgi:DNA polymerase III alpha subunit